MRPHTTNLHGDYKGWVYSFGLFVRVQIRRVRGVFFLQTVTRQELSPASGKRQRVWVVSHCSRAGTQSLVPVRNTLYARRPAAGWVNRRACYSPSSTQPCELVRLDCPRNLEFDALERRELAHNVAIAVFKHHLLPVLCDFPPGKRAFWIGAIGAAAWGAAGLRGVVSATRRVMKTDDSALRLIEGHSLMCTPLWTRLPLNTVTIIEPDLLESRLKTTPLTVTPDSLDSWTANLYCTAIVYPSDATPCFCGATQGGWGCPEDSCRVRPRPFRRSRHSCRCLICSWTPGLPTSWAYHAKHLSWYTLLKYSSPPQKKTPHYTDMYMWIHKKLNRDMTTIKMSYNNIIHV